MLAYGVFLCIMFRGGEGSRTKYESNVQGGIPSVPWDLIYYNKCMLLLIGTWGFFFLNIHFNVKRILFSCDSVCNGICLKCYCLPYFTGGVIDLI